MDYKDYFGMSGQEDERRDETEAKKTFLKDGNQMRSLGGKF